MAAVKLPLMNKQLKALVTQIEEKGGVKIELLTDSENTNEGLLWRIRGN